MTTATGTQHGNKYRLNKSRGSFAASLPSQGELASALKDSAREVRAANTAQNRDQSIETFAPRNPKKQFSPYGPVTQTGATTSSSQESIHSSRRYELENMNLEHITDPSYRARASMHIKRQAIAYAKQEATEIIKGSLQRYLKSKDLGELAELLEDEDFINTTYDAASRSVKGDHEIAKAMAALMISWWTAELWLKWQWTSIPAILSGVGILDFMAATVASWVALADTLFHPLLEQSLGKMKAAALPPSFSFLPGVSRDKWKLSIRGMGKGLEEFVFFLAAHAIWFLIFIAAIAAVIITILPFVLPFFAAGVIIQTVTGG